MKAYKTSWIGFITLALLILSACQEPSEKPIPDSNKIPVIGLSIPASLTSSGDALAKSLVSGPNDDAASAFEPFRVSLAFAQAMIEEVNRIIVVLNTEDIPDTLDYTNDLGERLVITTDATRQYTTLIEQYTPGGDKFFQVNYTKGADQVVVVMHPLAEDATSGTAWIHLFYNGEGATPTFSGKLVFAEQDVTVDQEHIPTAIILEVIGGSPLKIAGGIAFQYSFGDITGINPDKYLADHAYMFQALADTVTGDALVNLYFPPATEATTTMPHESVGGDYMEIVHSWVILPGNTSVQDLLTTITLIPGTNFSYDTPEGLREILEYVAVADPSADMESLLFLINLDNPVAYNDALGYVTHGDTVTAAYTDLGTPGTVAFPAAPSEINALILNFISQ